VDYAAACLSDFVCGANEEGKHLTGVNWGTIPPTLLQLIYVTLYLAILLQMEKVSLKLSVVLRWVIFFN